MSGPEDLDRRLAGLSSEKRELLRRRLAARADGADGGGRGATRAMATAAAAAASGAPPDDAIAIIGAACRLPGGVRSPTALWALLSEGRDAVAEIPPDRWDAQTLFSPDPGEPDHISSRWGGLLDRLDEFDAGFFGISPREAAAMDPQQRLLMELSWEALEAAGQVADRLAGSQTGVFVGVHSLSSDYLLMQLGQAQGIESHTSTGSAHSILANRISYALDLRGPSMAVDTACSSSLVALHLACQSLRTGETDLALAAGVNLMLMPTASLAFTKLQILSPGGRCRTFDAAADGIARGEGCVVVALKRLGEARRDGDPVLAVIRGSAVNQDGASNGLTAPNGAAQEAVIRRALQVAGIAGDRVGLIETHGTGTALGDPVEVEALTKVFGGRPAEYPRCFLGALKTNLGHLEGAAGIAGLLKAVLCLRQRMVPANLHFSSLNPHIRLEETPFVIPTTLQAWHSVGAPRIAGVSSFGFGGTNAHVVLEEYVTPVDASVAADDQGPVDRLLTLSARSRLALIELAVAYRSRLEGVENRELSAIVTAAATRRTHHPHRLAVVGATAEEFGKRLSERVDGDGPGAPVRDAGSGGPVFVFSGQGGQWAGMGRALYEGEASFRRAVDEVAALYRRHHDRDLVGLLTGEVCGDALTATDSAQPALFALQIGLAALWQSWGLRPAAVIGHSVGEVAAACVAGVLTLADAVAVIHHRSAPMQALVGRGRMAQVELGEVELAIALRTETGELSIAAVNGPSSTVVSGEPDAVERLIRRMTDRGVVVRPLPGEFAFHSSQMDALTSGIADALSAVRPGSPSVPLISTVSGTWCVPADYDARYWARNVRQAVRFAPGITELLRAGFRCFVEIGPHPALGAGIAAAASELSADDDVTVVSSLRRQQGGRAALLGSLGRLYEAGAAIDWSALADARSPVPALPGYPWQRRTHWLAPVDPAALMFNVTGHRLERAAQSAGAPAPGPEVGCYRVDWESASDENASQSAAASFSMHEGSVELIAIAAQSAVMDRTEAAELAAEAAYLPQVERRAAALASSALDLLGVDRTAGAFIDGSARAGAGVLPAFQRLWERLLSMLAEERILQRDGDRWRATGASLPESRGALAIGRVEARLLERCGGALADVLTGRTDPLALLFPEDGLASAGALYAESPGARLYNQMIREALRSVLPMRRPGRRLRVLEIGAGTGGTTSSLIDVLPAGTEYVYTDISPMFLHEARQRYRGTSIDWSFRRLDIEVSPLAQGFLAGGADIVIASNVLHAAADLRRAIGHVHQLLSPGGILMLLETVAPRRWADLTFGLTEGWWRFADIGLRERDALLAVHRWTGLLAECGFMDARSAGAEFSQFSLHPQALLLARRPPDQIRPRMDGTRWLVLTDAGGVAEGVAAGIEAEGGRCDRLAASTADPGRLEAALGGCGSGAGGVCDGVIHFGALDAVDAARSTPESLDASIDTVLVPALRVAQALLRCPNPARMWLVTRTAQQVGADQRAVVPAQAPLWGLGRSFALEAPSIWGGLIDLDDDPAGDVGHQADVLAVIHELCAARAAGAIVEDQVAWRDGRRFLARLVRDPDPPARGLVLRSDASYLITGGYGGLGPKVADWLAACGARRIVLLGRSGLPHRGDWERLAEGDPGFEAVQTIRRLEAAGVAVTAARGDVADRPTLERLVSELETSGSPLGGVVHAAAAIAIREIERLTVADLHEALRAKVLGAWLLHDLTRTLPLDLFVLFSSGTTVLGAKGLSAYAASNQFLTALAAERTRHGLPVTCVDWGAWSEIRLLGADRQADVGRFGLRAMRDGDAFRTLAALIVSGVPQALVASIDLPLMTQAYQIHGIRPILRHLARESGDRTSTAGDAVTGESTLEPARADVRAALTGLSARAARDRMTNVVKAELAHVLRWPAGEPIDENTGFFDLGLDSLMAVQFRRRLAARTGENLPATLTFNYPNVAALVTFLLSLLERGRAAMTEPITRTSDPRLAAVVPLSEDSLSALSDSEVQALLRAELRDLSRDSVRGPALGTNSGDRGS